MERPLETEFKYYLANQGEFVKQFNGRFIAMKGMTVLGPFQNEIEAISEAQKEWELGTFLVQKVEPGDSAYTQTYHSRVAF
jgi:hypothetical protein